MKKLFLVFLMTAGISMSFTACSQNDNNTPSSQESSEVKNVSLDTILDAIKAAYGDDYYPDSEIPEEFLETEFGLTPDMYDDIRAEMAMISTRVDRVVIVKAKEGKADAIEEALNDAKDKKLEDGLQYPMNIAKVKSTQVVRNGDYLAFILAGAINDADNVTEDEALKFAETETQKGVDAFESALK